MLNIGIMIILILISLFRGDGKSASVIGIHKCSGTDIFMLVLLFIFVVAFTLFSIFKVLLPEYKEKKEVGYDFIEGDFECTK